MADQPDARVAMNDFLTSIGLGDLAGWAYDQFTNGNTPTQVYQNLRLQPAWQQRYQVIVQREANGLSPMSEADVLNYEKQAKALMQAAGMPASFYDQPEDFVALAGTPFLVSSAATAWARRTDSFWLYASVPIESV